MPPTPASHLVEGKSLHYHPLVRVLSDGKGSLGLQEVVDLLVVHLRRKEAGERHLRDRARQESSARGAGKSELLGGENVTRCHHTSGTLQDDVK